MNIEVTYQPQPTPVEEKTYPWLGIAKNGQIVFFVKEKCGIVVLDKTDHYEVGVYHETFIMKLFKKFKGKITISN